MDRLRRAGGAAWMEHLRAAGRSPAAVGRRSERGGAAGARAMSAARATSSARVIMHVGSPDAARAQDVASRWSRRARSWRRACRDGRSHRGRGARPHDRARRDKRDGQRDGVEPRGRRHRG